MKIRSSLSTSSSTTVASEKFKVPALSLSRLSESVLLGAAIFGSSVFFGGCSSSGEDVARSCESFVEISNEDFVGGAVFDRNGCYLVNENLSLDDGTVEIQAGAQLHFASNVEIQIREGGRLLVDGTASNRVYFIPQDPLVTWRGIRLNDSQGVDNSWSYLTIENAGNDNWNGAAYSGAAVFLEGTTTLAMDAVHIDSSLSHGIVVREDVDFSFANGTLSNNVYPAYLHPDVVPGIGAETLFESNENQVLRLVFGNNDSVTRPAIWPSLSIPYRIEDRFKVQSDLTLDAGAVLEFHQDKSLIVEESGSLTAIGSADSPIAFQGVAGTRGYWKGIEIEAGGTGSPASVGASFDYCSFSDAGSSEFTGRSDTLTALYMGDQSGASITNSTFTNNALYSIWASSEARFVEFEGNTFSENARSMLVHADRLGELSGTSVINGNDEDAIYVGMGNTDRVSVQALWKDMGVPYRIEDRLTVEAELSIEAGTVLEFSQDIGMLVDEDGSLSALGESGKTVQFRGKNAIAEGYWRGIRFLSNSAANELSFAEVLHAGSDQWNGAVESDAAIFVENGALVSVDETQIGPGGGHGIYLAQTATLACTNVAFSGLAKGAVYARSSDSVLAGCP